MKKSFLIFSLIFFPFFYSHNVLAQEDKTGNNRDRKVYQWICSLQRPCGLVEEAERSNFVSLYSNSLAAIVFTYKGDPKKAKKIFAWFLQNKKEWEKGPGGFGQFRDANGYVAAPHRWMGDNAWFLIALRYYEKKTGDTQFQGLAEKIEKWLRGLQDADGGLWGGYKSNSEMIEKNSEGNIDALNAVEGYDEYHKRIFLFLKKHRWDKHHKVFITDWMPYNHAPDLISWGYMALGGRYEHFLDFADEFMITQKSSVGPEITGIGFDLVEKDGVWIEATGQMALAYRLAGRKDKADFLICEIEKMYVPSVLRPHIGGMVYSTGRGTMFGPDMLWEGADKNPALGTSCWYLMARWKIDPMAMGRKELIEGLKKDHLY